MKLAYAPENSPHSLEFKFQFADQVSDQSYLGLTDAHIQSAPLRRYGVSGLDQITTDHDQTIVRYSYAPTDRLTVSFTAYNNTHARNWFKSEGMDFDGSESAAEFSRTSWSSINRRDQSKPDVVRGCIGRALENS